MRVRKEWLLLTARFREDWSGKVAVEVAMEARSRGPVSGEPQLDQAVQRWLDWDRVSLRAGLWPTLTLLSLTQLRCL